MNTNSRKIVRVILLPLLLFISSYANSINIMDLKLEPEGKHKIKVELSKDDYVIGTYSFSKAVSSLNLFDNKNRLIRRLDQEGKKNGEFHFLAGDTQEYYIEVKNRNQKNSIKIKIEKVIASKQDKTHEDEVFLSKKIENIYNQIKDKKNNTKKFWSYVKKIGTPLIEEYDKDNYVLTFLYRGAKREVKILGAPVSEHVQMKRLLDSDIWYKSFIVPSDTRLSYRLAPDVPIFDGTKWEKRVAILATAQMDPYNKYPLNYGNYKDKYNQLSSIVLPKQKFKDWTSKDVKDIFSKKDFEFKSSYLDNKREITLLYPKELKKDKKYSLLFIFDSVDYQSKVDTQSILNNLIAKKKIPEVIAVFISNPSPKARATELPCNENFANFMAKELYPYIKKELGIKFSAKSNILIGSSYGGLASSYVAFKYPEIFGNVLSLSGSYWWKPNNEVEYEWLTKQFVRSDKKPIEFFLAVGAFETGFLSVDMLEANRHFRDVLEAKKYKVNYTEFSGAHDYFSWRVILPYGLKILLK